MLIRIGVFVQSENRDLLEEWLAPFYESCEMHVFSYDHFSQLQQIFLEQKGKIDGSLFDTQASAHALAVLGLLDHLAWSFVEIQNIDLVRALTICQAHYHSLDFSRVLVDVGLKNNIDWMFADKKRPVFIAQDVWRVEASKDWADDALRRYRSAWDSGCFDLIVTRHVQLLDRLESLGIRACAVFPSADSVRHAANEILTQTHAWLFSCVLPACGVVGTRGGTQALEPLGQALEAFNAQNARTLLITRRSGLYELETSNRQLMLLTDHLRGCTLRPFLHERLADPVCIGWGAGGDMLRARANAIRAYRESLFDREHFSYAVDSDGVLVGPLLEVEEASAAPIRPLPALGEASCRTGMSQSGLRRICGLLQSLGTDSLTSQQIAQAFGVTQRSAARMLSNLQKGGYALLVEEGSKGRRGRPPKTYKISL